MSQPVQTSSPLLARRIGPFPVFVWLILIAGTVALAIWWRRRNTSEANSTLAGVPGVYSAGSFVPSGYMSPNSQGKWAMTTEPDPNPYWSYLNAQRALYGTVYGAPVDGDGLVPGMPAANWRARSVTYPVTSNDSSAIAAVSRRYGFSGVRGQTVVFPDGRIVSPQ